MAIFSKCIAGRIWTELVAIAKMDDVERMPSHVMLRYVDQDKRDMSHSSRCTEKAGPQCDSVWLGNDSLVRSFFPKIISFFIHPVAATCRAIWAPPIATMTTRMNDVNWPKIDCRCILNTKISSFAYHSIFVIASMSAVCGVRRVLDFVEHGMNVGQIPLFGSTHVVCIQCDTSDRITLLAAHNQTTSTQFTFPTNSKPNESLFHFSFERAKCLSHVEP